jgi:hypothetical protein
MLTGFSHYEPRDQINEAGKVLHLDHIEDLAFSLSSSADSGPSDAIAFFRAIEEMLHGSAPKSSNISVKWDGSPAIYAGIDPETGKFFIGTKSIFNKRIPKLGFTAADIKEHYGHNSGLLAVLLAAYPILKRIPTAKWKGSFFQGDLLFTQKMLKDKTIDGEPHTTFQPNTIVYAVSQKNNPKLHAAVLAATIGIAWHTMYESDTTVADSSASAVSPKNSPQSTAVFSPPSPQIRDLSGTASLTKQESKILDKLLKKASPKMKKRLGAKSASALQIFLNVPETSGDTIKTVAVFTAAFVAHYAGKHNGEQPPELPHPRDVQNWMLFSRIKKILLQKMNKIQSLPSFLQKDNGFVVTPPEGFVISDTVSGNIVKLVDRLEFSRANFNINRGRNK